MNRIRFGALAGWGDCRAALFALRRDDSGVSALEFALTAPIFCFVLAGAVDFGGVVFAKIGLDGATSASANYALTRNAQVTSAAGGGLAATLAAVVTSNSGADGTVVVNNGPSVAIADGVQTSGGTAANANSCYCPTRLGDVVSWGGAVTCGDACTDGGSAGKFVQISANNTYAPLFSDYGIVANGTVSVVTMVQTQ